METWSNVIKDSVYDFDVTVSCYYGVISSYVVYYRWAYYINTFTFVQCDLTTLLSCNTYNNNYYSYF